MMSYQFAALCFLILMSCVNHLLLLFVLDKERLQSHRDFDQVVLDVNRSLKRFPPGLQSNYSLVDYPNLDVSGRPNEYLTATLNTA